METLYIIHPDPAKFTGLVLKIRNTETWDGDTDEEIGLTWNQFYDRFYEPYLKSIQKPFKQTTEDDFYEMLEVLPPKRWTRDEKGNQFFFAGECTTADLYSCYVKLNGTYYCALRSIHTKSEDLFNLSNVI
jgi:hypothetical protein